MDIKTKGTVFLLLTSLMWSASFILIKVADRTIPPFTFTAARMAFGAVILYLYLRTQGKSLPRIGRTWVPFVIMGIFGTLLPVLLLASGEEHVSAGLTAVLLSIVPVITVIIAHFFAGEHLTSAKVIGVGVGLAGAVIVVWPNLAQGVEATLIGMVMILCVALFRSSSNVYARIYLQGVSPAQTAAGMMISATAIILPLAFIVEDPLAVRPSTEGIIAVVLSGIFCSAIAYLLLYWLIANRGPTFASLIECITPAVTITLSALLMGAALQTTTIIGMAVLVLCIVIMNGYLGKGVPLSAKRPGSR